MARFRFRLQRLLRVQEILEEEACAVWRRAENLAATAEEHARSRSTECEGALADLASHLTGLRPVDVLWRQEQIDRMASLAARQRERARTLRHQADVARVPFDERRRERRALERLRERVERRHLETQRRHEAVRADETTLARARARRGRNE